MFSNLFMDFIRAYQDEGSTESVKREGSDDLPQPVLKKMHVNAAPDVTPKSAVRNCLRGGNW